MHLFCCLALLSFLSPCFAADEEAAFLHQPAHPLFYRPKRGHPVPKSDDTGQPINKLEYDSFLESLYLMRDARIKNFNRLDLIMPALAPKPRPTSHEFSFRKFNFSTGIQFEDDFDCDLNLLANCESSLLEKIEKIEGRRVVFTLNRTEEDEVASQFDILNLCRSMDIEFTCLLNYAEKCEKKMRWPTFSILKYIITANNETIVSCRHKEKDWLGGENPNIQEEWIDPNGITHYHSRHSSPCIKPNEIYSCFLETLGYQFDLSRDSLHLQPQCEAALRFEHCIKSIVFENFLQTKQSNLTSPPCSLDEKEATLEILLGSFRFGKSFSSLCNELRYRWKRNNSIGGNERIEFSDTYDEAKRMAQVLQSHYDSKLDYSLTIL